MTSMTGGCLCGRVRYTVTGDPLASALCHCRKCQRYTGSAFEAVMVFPNDSIDFQGELKTFDDIGGSGQAVHRRFCPNCGSGIVNEIDVAPDKMILLVGTLDDPTVFVPTIEVFCHAAQPWVHSDIERERFSTGPT